MDSRTVLPGICPRAAINFATELKLTAILVPIQGLTSELELEPESAPAAMFELNLDPADYKISVKIAPDSRCCWISQVARPPNLPDLRGSQRCAPNCMNVIVDIWATTVGIFGATPFVREMQGVQISGIEKSAKHSPFPAKYPFPP